MKADTAGQVVAAFDFDGTITRRDTLFPFLLLLCGWPRLLFGAIVLLPTLLGYVLRIIPNDVAKERVLRRFVGGMSEPSLRREAEGFAADVLPRLVRPEALDRLTWHKRQGHRCVVISASIEHYVAPWARRAGFDEVIATRLERDAAQRLSGRYDGANCYGPEKVRRLLQLLGQREDYVLYAYGDSRGDRELLALADHPYYRTMPGMEHGG